jgi:hypothetical protein
VRYRLTNYFKGLAQESTVTDAVKLPKWFINVSGGNLTADAVKLPHVSVVNKTIIASKMAGVVSSLLRTAGTRRGVRTWQSIDVEKAEKQRYLKTVVIVTASIVGCHFAWLRLPDRVRARAEAAGASFSSWVGAQLTRHGPACVAEHVVALPTQLPSTLPQPPAAAPPLTAERGMASARAARAALDAAKARAKAAGCRRAPAGRSECVELRAAVLRTRELYADARATSN